MTSDADALSLSSVTLTEAVGDAQDAALQDAVRRSLLAADTAAFCAALVQHGETTTETKAQLVFLMDWFHRWQREYEAFAEVLEAELADADEAESAGDDEVAREEEEEEEEEGGGEPRGIQFVEKDLEELEAEAQQVFKGFSAIALVLLESLPASADELLDKHGWTLLMQAANSGLRDLVDALVARGVDVNYGGSEGDGITPLYLALSSDHTNEAMALLKNGAIASATRVVTTALETTEDAEEEGEEKAVEEDCAWLQACRMGQLAVIEEMLALGVDVNFALPTSGDRALHIAVMFEMQDVVELLIASDKHEINAKNKSGQTCLFGCSNVELAQFLVQTGGVDVRVKDVDDESAYSMAKALGDDNVAEFLEPFSQ